MNTEDIQGLEIRRATEADAAKLAALGREAFSETFGHLYPPADLAEFLDTAHSESNWHAMLADPRRATWLALKDGQAIAYHIVGACKLPVDDLEPTAGEIQQLYVLARHHNLKLGTRLMERGLAWLEQEGFSPLYIGVWSENLGAQRFYGRYGFEKFGEYGFPVGDTVDREFILKRSA
ncbi:MAG: GNAT family N-acetyltransferase [Gammaproteobacteria bacterium]|nr:GNAT family N-acetyltransferase [Gammaproteobacteria bacterium]